MSNLKYMVEVKSNLDKLLKQNERLIGQVDRLKSSAAKTASNTGFGKLTSAFGIGAVMGNAAVAAIAAVGTAMSTGATAGVGYLSTIEQATVAYSTLTGSSKEANKQIAALTEYANKTPFELPEILEAGKALTSVGMSAKDNIKWLGDMASINPGAGIGEAGDAIARLKSGDFGEAFQKLRQQFRISKADLEGAGLKFDKKGQYVGTVKQAMDAVQGIVQKKYGKNGGLAQAQGQTFGGMMSTLKDAGAAAAGEAMKPLFNWLKGMLPSIIQLVNRAGQGIKGMFAFFAKVAADPAVKAAVAELKTEFAQMAAVMGPVLKDIAKDLGPSFFNVVKAGFMGFATSIQTIVVAVRVFGPQIARIIGLLMKVGFTATAIGLRFQSAFHKNLQVITNAFRGPAKAAEGMVKDISRWWNGLKLNPFDIPMPHFWVTGKLDLFAKPPQIPKMGVNWYASGGYFDRPSVIGVGEKGGEYVLNQGHIKALARELGGGVHVTVNATVGSDYDVARLAERLADHLSARSYSLGV